MTRDGLLRNTQIAECACHGAQPLQVVLRQVAHPLRVTIDNTDFYFDLLVPPSGGERRG